MQPLIWKLFAFSISTHLRHHWSTIYWMILVISWQCTALDDCEMEVHKIEGISKSTVQGVSLFQSFFEREHITIEKQKKKPLERKDWKMRYLLSKRTSMSMFTSKSLYQTKCKLETSSLVHKRSWFLLDVVHGLLGWPFVAILSIFEWVSEPMSHFLCKHNF